MKKLLISLLMFAFLSPFVSNVNASNGENLQASILKYSLLNDSQAKDTFGKPLDCESEAMQLKLELYSSNKKQFDEEMDKLKSTDPGMVKDIKGCTLERTVNGIVKWIVYLVILGFSIWAVVIIGTEMLGGDKGGSSGSSMDMGMQEPGGSSGGNNKLLEKLKTPLWGIGILVLLILGALNVFIKIIQFIFDSIV